MAELSILVPARNEQYLQRTIEDIFEHAEGDTEVIVGLDGPQQPDWGGLKLGDRFNVILSTEQIGQRAVTNACAKTSTAKYLMKIDAHCSFSQGFDVEMMRTMDDRTIMGPYLLRLDAKKWEVMPQLPSSQFVFDTELVMQFDRKVENQQFITETMCLQGSAWMITRENYWKWNICDETLGSWGGQAAELGIKAYLNGGRCVTNKNCFYGHMFREKEEDFPYQRNKGHIKDTLDELRRRYRNKSIEGLIRKFNLPADWTEDKIKELK